MIQYSIVITTTPTKAIAKDIACMLTTKKLAACAQIIGPLESAYWWKGTIEQAREWMIVAKTRQDLFQKLEAAIVKIHPYDAPEIIAIPLLKIGKKYLRWLNHTLAP